MSVPGGMAGLSRTEGGAPRWQRRIVRTAVAPLAGIEAASLAALRQALGAAGLPLESRDWIAADLSLGSWTSQHLGSTLRAQLGRDPAVPRSDAGDPAIAAAPRDRMRDAALIGELVDAESRGNLGIITALDHAREIAAALDDGRPRSVLVLAPRFGIAWRADDLACLRFLAFALARTSARLVLVAPDRQETGLPGGFDVDWSAAPADDAQAATATGEPPLAALVPGVVEARLGAGIGLADLPPENSAALPGGAVLIDPALRVRPSARLRHLFDRLGAAEGLDPALKAFAQVHGSGYFADPVFLLGQSWQCFTAGGHEIALDLMQHAVACAPDAGSRGRFVYELQGMRIALQKFDDARQVAPPDPGLPAEVRAGIILTKGWGAVLSGHAEEGREHLSTALAMLGDSIGGTSQFLYLKNIYALSLVRTGAWGEAMQQEKEIEAELDRAEAADGVRDWPMTYVNSLNQARLYKYRKDFEQSFACYQRGFATTLGARSESDAVYANYCLAKLHAEHGHDHEAFLCWLRAALHWAAAEVPEALAMRVTAGILGRRTGPYEPVAERISDVFCTELSAAADRVGVAPRGGAPAMIFRRTEVMERLTDAVLVGGTGWAVAVAPDPGIGPALAGASHDGLRALLSGIVRAAAPAAALSGPSVGVLPCTGTGEVPLIREDALLTAAQHGIADVSFETERIALAPGHSASILAGRRIRHGHAAGGWSRRDDGGVNVVFKRNRHAVELSGLDAEVFSAAARPVRHDLLATDADRAAAVERLVAAGILAGVPD